MKNNFAGQVLSILTIIILLTFSGCSSETETISQEPVDAPDFTLDSVTGENIRLSDFRVKWYSWTSGLPGAVPVSQSIPELVRLQKKYSG